MLELRPSCERCDRELPGDSPDAFICSFECTYCGVCAGDLSFTCPNCDGRLEKRPTRTGAALLKYPVSMQQQPRSPDE